MKRYLIYELKKSTFFILCVTVVMAVIYFISLATGFMDYPSWRYTYLSVIAALGGVAAAGMPAYVFEYKMKRRSADLYYSLPLSHRHVLLVKYILGLIAVFGPYSLVYWLGAFIGMNMAFSEINAIFYLANYAASLIPIYIIYSISSFIFTRANTFGDGVVFCLFWAFVMLLIMTIIRDLVDGIDFNYFYYYNNPKIYPYSYPPYAPLNFITEVFSERLVKGGGITRYTSIQMANFWVGSVINLLMSAGATFGLIFTEGKVKAENVSQISGSYFGYKVMIPLYTFCLAFICEREIALLILLAVAAYLVTVGYKRTLKIGWKSAILIAAPLVLGNVAYLITYAIQSL